MLVELMLMSIHRHEVLGAGFFVGTAVSGKPGTWVEMWALYWVVLLEGVWGIRRGGGCILHGYKGFRSGSSSAESCKSRTNIS